MELFSDCGSVPPPTVPTGGGRCPKAAERGGRRNSSWVGRKRKRRTKAKTRKAPDFAVSQGPSVNSVGVGHVPVFRS